jgi:hypothetical protein
MVRKLLVLFGLVVLSFAALTASVGADHGPSPSDSEDACDEAGGTFSVVSDAITECVVVTVSEEDAAASHPVQDWVAVMEVTTTTTYTTEVEVVEIPGTQVWNCYNPGGEVVASWAPGEPAATEGQCASAFSNCEEGATECKGGPALNWTVKLEGTAPTYDTILHHSENTEAESEQIGCMNHQGKALGGTAWASNPNCKPAPDQG